MSPTNVGRRWFNKAIYYPSQNIFLRGIPATDVAEVNNLLKYLPEMRAAIALALYLPD
jgi:hypothetical protein